MLTLDYRNDIINVVNNKNKMTIEAIEQRLEYLLCQIEKCGSGWEVVSLANKIDRLQRLVEIKIKQTTK